MTDHPHPEAAAVLADVAARYGVAIAPGVRVQAVPRGVSGLDGADSAVLARMAEARRVASLRALKRRKHAETFSKVAAFVRPGRTLAEIAAASGYAEGTVRAVLNEQGHAIVRGRVAAGPE